MATEEYKCQRRREFLKMAGFGTVVALVGGGPLGTALAGRPGGHTFALRGDGKVVVIDQASEEVVTAIDTGAKGGTLGSLSADGKRLFVANNAAGQRTVSVIDADALSLVGSVETGNSPKHPVVSPDGKLVAVNHSGLDGGALRVAFLDPSSGAVVRTVALPVANTEHKGPASMHGAWSPDGAVFAIGSYADNKAWFIRRADFAAKSVEVGGNPHYFDWIGRQVWVTVEYPKPKAADAACRVAVIDCADETAPKPAGDLTAARAGSEADSLARIEGHHGVFTDDGSRFLLCNRGDGPFEGISIQVLDRASRASLAHLESPAKGVGHAYLSPDGRHVLITQYGDTRLPVLDLTSLSIVKTIDAGSGGHLGHATFSADGAKAFVSNRKADEVLVLNMRKLEITKRIATGSAGQAQGQVVNTPYGVFERVRTPHLG